MQFMQAGGLLFHFIDEETKGEIIVPTLQPVRQFSEMALGSVLLTMDSVALLFNLL
jgi:hypothetical protein